MHNVLIVETSTETGSIALASDGSLAAELSFLSRNPANGARTEALAPAVAQCLAFGSVPVRDLSAIICGAGPGGFTSLRAAAAFAKGICSALNIPLYAVSSLVLLAWSAELADGPFVVALHAGRNEWFGADVDRADGRSVLTSAAYLLGDAEIRARAARMHATMVGPALDINTVPLARSVLPHLSDIEDRGPVDLDAWEPVYGRLAEAQVKWEAAHGRPLSV